LLYFAYRDRKLSVIAVRFSCAATFAKSRAFYNAMSYELNPEPFDLWSTYHAQNIETIYSSCKSTCAGRGETPPSLELSAVPLVIVADDVTTPPQHKAVSVCW
jgi:hypothetical protein